MSVQHKCIYEFDSFSVDREKRVLYRGDQPVQLTPKVFDTLLALIEDRGRILTKDELLQRIWGDTIVEEGGLARNISILRKVLGERPDEHRYIVTVPGKGYQFVAEVRDEFEKETAESATILLLPQNSPPSAKPHWSRVRLLLGGFFILVLGSLAYLVFLNESFSTQHKIRSLAVLPMKNLSGDPSQDYFADGITEALIGNLAQIRALNVISRRSAMTFKDAPTPLPEIARTLNVDAILEGSVQRENGRVKISIQLIDARTDAHLMSREYERNLTDVLKLQADVANAIADEIRVQVTPNEHAHLRTVKSVKPDAYDHYVLGRFHLWKFIWDDHERAIAHFEQAIAIDPNYAAAWAGLAQAWWQLAAQGERPWSQVENQARASAEKALELDDRMAAAHVAQGYVKWLSDADWKGAENSIRRVIELDPGSVDAHYFYGRLLADLARFPESIAQVQIAEKLDPISPAVQSLFGGILSRGGKQTEAAERLERAIEREPRSANAHGLLADVYATGVVLPLVGSTAA